MRATSGHPVRAASGAVRSLVIAASAAAALLAAPSARAEDPPDEVERFPPSSVRPKLIAGGLLITGVGYGAAFLGAEAAPNWPGAAELKVPVIGPWWALALNGCPADDPGCDAFQYLRAGLLVLDGLVQAAGLAVVVEAVLLKAEATPAAKAAATAFHFGSFTFKPTPLVSPTTAGLGFVGTF